MEGVIHSYGIRTSIEMLFAPLKIVAINMLTMIEF